MKTVLLKGGLAITPQGLQRTDILLRNGRIEMTAAEGYYEDSQPRRMAAGVPDKVINITGKYIVPGFVDIHFHGYNLFEFTIGKYDPKTNCYDTSPIAYQQGFDMLKRCLAEFGVTGFYLANWSTSIETLMHCYGQLADYLAKSNHSSVGAHLWGGLLEGPFINPDMAGAMNPEYVRSPAVELFDCIEDRGSIKLANVVPDFGPPSYELTRYLASKGIVVGAGHTNATYEQITKAIKAGLKYFIHFTNGPTGGSYKPFNGGGAIEAVLKSDELYAELICDGFHVNPAYVRDIIKRKGIDKILGVTDCTFIAGSDLKQFSIGGIRGAVSDDGSYFQVVGKPNTLFSSNLTMNRGFENLLNWLTVETQGIWNRWQEAMELEEALVTVAKIFATNPCKLTGLQKQGRGYISHGAIADLCILGITGSPGSYAVTIESTIVDGDIVYSAKL